MVVCFAEAPKQLEARSVIILPDVIVVYDCFPRFILRLMCEFALMLYVSPQNGNMFSIENLDEDYQCSPNRLLQPYVTTPLG